MKEKPEPKEEPKKEIKASNKRASVKELANILKDGVPVGSVMPSKKKGVIIVI